MTPPAEQLWARILAHLRQQGRLPLQSEQLTPLEIAALCHDGDSDERVQRFVHDYYYPHHFGETAGALSDAKAHELVTALESGVAADVQPDAAALATPVRRQTCHICERRAVPGQPS